MLVTSALVAPRCDVCGAAGKACSHAPTDGVTPTDPAAAVPRQGTAATGVYTVTRPEIPSGPARLRLSLADVAELRALGATVQAVPPGA